MTQTGTLHQRCGLGTMGKIWTSGEDLAERVERSALYIDLDLPMRENYSQMLSDFLGAQ